MSQYTKHRYRGTAVWYGPDGKVLRARDTYTCNHCMRVIVVDPPRTAITRDEPWNQQRIEAHEVRMCRQCMMPVCPSCSAEGICKTFEQKIEAFEARNRMFEAMGLPSAAEQARIRQHMEERRATDEEMAVMELEERRRALRMTG